MTDYFALLGESRRPWIDPEALQDKFRTLAAEAHPDRVHAGPEQERQAATTRYAELNAAVQCLRETRTRLAHLLELESGRKPAGIQTPPGDALALFGQVGQLCRDVDQFLVARDKVTSPLQKAQQFARSLEWTDRLLGVQQHLRERQAALEAELHRLNDAWEIAPAIGGSDRVAQLPLAQLEESYRLASYFGRWSSQLQERIVQLSL